jgi:signal transduction histidine kinase
MKDVLKNTAGYLPREGAKEIPQMEERIFNGSKASLIRKASHDIQGVFFGVSSLCAMIKDAKGNQKDMDILVDHLSEACHSYKYKLGNFLEFVRLEAGLRDTILERVDIRLLFERIINETCPAAAERKININLRVLEGTPDQIISDEFRIAQICNNLLSNAINFSPAGNSVLVQVESIDQDCLKIVVKDEGAGMTSEQLNTLFTLSGTDRECLKNPGGLSLLVTKYLVEDLLKGHLIVSSQPNVGSCCTVILPIWNKITSHRNGPAIHI